MPQKEGFTSKEIRQSCEHRASPGLHEPPKSAQELQQRVKVEDVLLETILPYDITSICMTSLLQNANLPSAVPRAFTKPLCPHRWCLWQELRGRKLWRRMFPLLFPTTICKLRASLC